jgi:hypothetical protein
MAWQAHLTRLSKPPNKPQPRMDMRGLWRLAIWGTSAAAALTLAAAASFSETGSRRIAMAMVSPGTGAVQPAPPAQVVVRSPEQEAETRRLTEAVRTLAADRDRLAARLGTVERNLEDLTGSIRRPETAPTPAGKAANLPATTEPQPGAPESAAQPAAPAPVTEPAKAEMGIDVGGATSADGLRALWNSTKANHAALVDGLHAVVATRENGRSKSKEMRLILGPVDSLEAAAQLCAALGAARRYCQPVAFEGQKLADAPERKPAPPKAATPASRVPQIFR